MIKDPTLILSEAMELDVKQESIDDEELVKEIDELDTVEENFSYIEEMIPVFYTKEHGYLVELDLLQKLVESKKITNSYYDEITGLEELKKHNNLSEDIGVLIESESYTKTNLARLKDQLKKEKNPKNKSIIKKRIDDTTNLLKKLKSRGKVVLKK